jgi:hypothetical protein
MGSAFLISLQSICMKSSFEFRTLYRQTELVNSMVIIEWQAGTDPSVARWHNLNPVRHLHLSVVHPAVARYDNKA